jgi:protein tyrosine phosphatase type 4A
MNQRSGSPLGRMLSLIESPSSVSLRFLILDCPTESTLPHYMEEFKQYQVTHIVRCCQPTYSTTLLNEQGIQVHDLPFKDGGIVSNKKLELLGHVIYYSLATSTSHQ